MIWRRIPDKLAEFELMVQRYNMTSGETLSDQVEKATILRTLSRTSQVTLVGQCSTISPMEQRYEQLSEIISWLGESGRPPTAMTRERDTSSPMDVDEVTWRWKGGNSKGKKQ